MAREGKDALGRRVVRMVRALRRAYPEATCALTHATPLQLLIATILSAQCTDLRVNQVTPALFARYRSVRDFARAEPADLETLIRSTGFYQAKARHIIGCCRGLVAHFGGELPRTLAELVTLPGVGRKTANVLLGTAWGVAEGIVVDTHVARITGLLRLTRQRDPTRIERDLMALLPRTEWIAWSHRLIWHGRRVCIARRPRCAACCLRTLCPSARMTSVGPSPRRGRT